MKLLFILILISVGARSQHFTRSKATEAIDSIVNKTNDLFMPGGDSFLHNETDSSQRVIREVWHYYNNSPIMFFSVDYSVDSINYEERYCLNNNQLIYAQETETTLYSSSSKDYITWGGKYYFADGKMIYYETLGHGKSETESWDPEKEVMEKFNKRLAILKQNQK